MLDEIPINVCRIIGEQLILKDLGNVRTLNKCIYANLSDIKKNAFVEGELTNECILESEGKQLLKGIVPDVSVNRLFIIRKFLENMKYEAMEIKTMNKINEKVYQDVILYGLTNNQNEIAKYKYKEGESYSIQAFAGTGKTTTLAAIAKNNLEKRILYVAFNTKLAEAAKTKFKKNVEVNTIHSLALKNVSEMEISKLKINKVANYLNINVEDAVVVIKILESFFASKHTKFKIETITGNFNNNYFFPLVDKLWRDMLMKRFPMTHDGYVKLFLMKNVQLEYDIIMIDEAQDINDCMLRFLMKQKGSKIFVGDKHQKIYGFRNTSNVLDEEHNKTFYLNQSFRYSYNLSNIMNKFLKKFKNEKIEVIPNNKNTEIVDYFKPDERFTVISRTNKNMMINAMNYAMNKKSIYIIGNKEIKIDEEIKKVEALYNIREFGNTTYEKYAEFKSIGKVEENAILMKKKSMKLRIEFLKLYTYDEYITKLYALKNYLVNKYEECDICVTTCHQAKGIEFDNVKIDDDFGGLKTVIKTENMKESYNIMYVALTRAKNKIILNNSFLEFLGEEEKWFNVFNISKIPFVTGWCGKCFNTSKFISEVNWPVNYNGTLQVCKYVCSECLPNKEFTETLMFRYR